MIDLYTWTTPNGRKVSILLEELGIEYRVHTIDISKGDQFSAEFLQIAPNNRIPAIVDHETGVQLMESAAIMLYLSDKYNRFHCTGTEHWRMMEWLMWQMGAGPFLGGGFGHFYAYAPEKLEYPIDRYAMEVKRQLDLLDKNLANRRYLSGDEYDIADMASYPWYGTAVLHNLYDAAEFLNVASYKNVIRWAEEIEERPAVQRGLRVNRVWGPEEHQLAERHNASDFDS